ncbi:MAG: acyltransferase, partial [Bacteroidota bacterium]
VLNKLGYQISSIEHSNYRQSLNQSQLSNITELKRRGAVIGENVDILDNCIIDPDHCFHIKIGDNVTFAPNVHVLAHDASTKKFIGYTKVKNTSIGSNVFVGAGTIILPGVTIGNNVIIAAGSVVIRDIPDGKVFGGNPAKELSTISLYLEKMRGEMNNENTLTSDYIYENLTFNRINDRVKIAERNKTIFIP